MRITTLKAKKARDSVLARLRADRGFVFFTVATQSGELQFTWKDDRGGVATHVARVEVSD